MDASSDRARSDLGRVTAGFGPPAVWRSGFLSPLAERGALVKRVEVGRARLAGTGHEKADLVADPLHDAEAHRAGLPSLQVQVVDRRRRDALVDAHLRVHHDLTAEHDLHLVPDRGA